MDKTHEFRAALLEMAVELGRTPTRFEFKSRTRGADYYIRSVGWEPFVRACGLEPDARSKPKKIDNSIFERDLEKHLEEYTPRNVVLQTLIKPWPKIAVISDIHWPFSSKRVLAAFLAFIEKHQPDIVILNGDAWDMYSHGKYPRSHNVFTPKQEQELARAANVEFWAEVKKRCPNARCVQMMGNHDLRPLKRIVESYPEAEDWVKEKIQSLFTFDGVETFHDSREELALDGNVLVFHGYRSKLGDHRDYTQMNCIVGHTHLGGASFRQIRGAVLWELNSGVAGDPEAKGLTYTPQKTTHWTPGFGWVDQYGPRFIAA